MLLPPILPVLFACFALSVAELFPEEEFNVTAESIPIFKTQPDFRPVLLKVLNRTQEHNRLQPGLLFVAPHIFHIGFGPHIFTQDGELVWYGQQTVGEFGGHRAQAMDFMPCDYLGQKETHFCYSEGRPKARDLDPARRTGGLNRIFDNTYTQVGSNLVRSGGFDPPNPHEFVMTAGSKTFLQSIFHKKHIDLRPYRGRKNGWVYEPCFQEVDVRTKRQIFRWCYLAHHPIWETDVFLRNGRNTHNRSTRTGGRGTVIDPWDFAHLNAVDKNEEGDYLVSLRHFDQILKIAGPDNPHGLKPGTTLWRLGGNGADIEILDEEAVFSRQHHSRFVSTSADETVISVFDNSYDGVYRSSNSSAGKIIVINNSTNTAHLKQAFRHPYERLAASQGSVQVFESGNTFIGWGARPQLSEFAPDGTLLYHAQILPDPGNLTNYRSFKSKWIGEPSLSDLKLVPYCFSCKTFTADGHPLYGYVSWNGATKVKQWRFRLSATSTYGPWFDAGTFNKTSFETKVELKSDALARVASFAPWVSVEAIDDQGQVIASKLTQTFVPGHHLRNKCNSEGCFVPQRFLYANNNSRGLSCRISAGPMTIVLMLLCIALEVMAYLHDSFIYKAASPKWAMNSVFRTTGVAGTKRSSAMGPAYHDTPEQPQGRHQPNRDP